MGDKEKRIYVIATIIFAVAATSFYFFQRYFMGRNVIKKEGNAGIAEKLKLKVKGVIPSNSSSIKLNQEVEKPLSIQEQPPENPNLSFVEIKKEGSIPSNKESMKQIEVENPLPIQEKPPENPNLTLVEIKREGSIPSNKESIEQTEVEKPLPIQNKPLIGSKMIDGKIMSNRTIKCREFLQSELTNIHKEFGSAIDNGDCFFDAFAKSLSILLKREVTLKELRKIVSEQASKLSTIKGDEMDSREDYLSRVEYDCEESLQLGFLPVWGKESRDGQILCNFFNVDLTVYKVAADAEFLFFIEDFQNVESKKGKKAIGTVEIALYPGHFVPVYDKT